MNAINIFSRLRHSAATSPVTCVGQVSRFSVGAILAVGVALVACSAASPAASAQTVTYAGSGAVNFGSANVCPSGKTTPAPCSQTMTLTYKVTASGSLGTPQALTLGAPNLDYKLASGSTCTGSVIQGNSCTVKVTFAPIAPGARNGAVEVVDGTGKVLATTYVYGTGGGPRIGFNPPAQRVIGNRSVSSAAVAVDGSGNLFVVEGSSIEELLAVNGSVPADPTTKVLTTLTPGLFASATALAVDGAGNVFFTVSYYPQSGYVEEVLAAGGYATTSILAGGDDFTSPYGVAVDGSGNVFVVNTASGDSSYTPGGNFEIPVAGGYTTFKTLAGENEAYDSQGIAVDANGNLFIGNNGGIIELPAADAYTTFRTISLGSSTNSPYSIAIDSAGDLFVASDNTLNIVELLAIDGVLPSNPASVVLNQPPAPTGQFTVSAIAFGASGKLYLVNDGSSGVQELQISTPSSLHFAQTMVGDSSSDSPKSIEIQNQGNTTLDVTSLSLSSPNFDMVPGSGTPKDCAASFSLVSSGLCNLSISFKPTEGGPLAGAVTLDDNTLNAPGSMQSALLSGTGDTFPPPQITSLSNTYGAPYSVVILNGLNFGATQGSSTVTFNGIATPHYHWADSKIYVTVPPDATTGNLTVNVGGESSTPIVFPVLPQPAITGISPTSANEGAPVTITGENLLDYGNHPVMTFVNEFKVQQVYVNVVSSTTLQTQVPFGVGLGPGHFHLLINDTGMNTSTFTVTK
jgi:sugar lactone lactonase YvrE